MTSTGRIGCPFCSGWFQADSAALTVEHSAPPCEKFERTGPLEFVIAARRALGIPAAEEDAS